MYSNEIVLHKEMMQNPNSENKLIVLSVNYFIYNKKLIGRIFGF
jgi:hypothetical protein